MKYSIRVILGVSLLLYSIFMLYKINKYLSSAPNIHQSNCGMPMNRLPKLIQGNDSSENCYWKFDHYVGSAWEMFWYDNIDVLQENVCATLTKAEQMDKSFRMLDRITILQQSIFNRSSMSDDNELFSQMFYRIECSSGQSTLVAQQIEPLIGLLRDPLTICPSFNNTIPSRFVQSEDHDMQSKRFLLLAPSSPYFSFIPTVPIAPWIYQKHGQKILFDIGSSYFNGLKEINKIGSATGAQWFYEYFRKNSLRFDRIIAFEQGLLSPTIAWEQIPEDILPVYTLINVAVQSSGKYNPLKMLQSLAKPQDYVIFKLDIDAFDLEKQFIEQIIENEVLHSLIDELFFEMHVTLNEMAPYWQFTAGPLKLKDAYVLFSKLRKLGIRMHSWP